MENCNESGRRSGAVAHSTDAATVTGAAATVIEPAAAPSKKPQTELIEVPTRAMASLVPPLESDNTDGAKTDSLGTRPSKAAIESALPNTKAGASETEQEAAKASLPAIEAAKPPRGSLGYRTSTGSSR